MAATEARATQPVLEEEWVETPPAGMGNTFGEALDSAGDVNGDGFDDLIVGSSGKAGLYRGSSSGLKTQLAWSASGSGRKSFFGKSVAGVGDVNGDGYDDVLVGDMGKRSGYRNGQVYYDGQAYLFLGSSTGLSTTADVVLDGSPSHFGGRVSAAGDVDGDGFDDVLVAGTHYDFSNCQNAQRTRTVQLYRGTSTGLDKTPSWSAQANKSGACFGYAISAGGDVNDDGYDDVLIGAPWYPLNSNPLQRGKAYVYEGSPSGLKATPLWTKEHPKLAGKGIHFGLTVAGGGDVDGDGIDDIVISSEGKYGGDGLAGYAHRAFVYHGSASGPSSTFDGVVGTATSAGEGPKVSFAGDVDNDGYDDVLWFRKGKIKMYHGSASGVVPTVAWQDTAQGVSYGDPRAGAGDVNGDGFADIALNSSGAAQLIHKLRVYHGHPNPAPAAQAVSIVADRGHAREVTLQGSDYHGDPLTFSIASHPQHGGVFGLTSAGPSSATVNYTYFSSSSSVKTDAFQFAVTDPFGNTDTARVDVTLESPPEFVPPTPSEKLYVEASNRLSFTVAATDPNGDTLTYGVVPMPDGAAIDASSGKFQWTPGNRQGGLHTVDITASDGLARIRRQIVIEVDAPVIDAGMDAGGGRDAGDAGYDATGDTAPPLDTGDTHTPMDTDTRRDTRADDATDSSTSEQMGVAPNPPDTTGVDTDAANVSQPNGCGCHNTSPTSPLSASWLILLAALYGRRRKSSND